MAESEHVGEETETEAACACGCKKEHKQNVSQTLRNPYGRGFDVICFYSEACKNQWNKGRSAAKKTVSPSLDGPT